MAKEYKIKSGDSLSQIAKAHGTTVSEIAGANDIKDVNKIYAGQTLTIPGQTNQSFGTLYKPTSKIPTDKIVQTAAGIGKGGSSAMTPQTNYSTGQIYVPEQRSTSSGGGVYSPYGQSRGTLQDFSAYNNAVNRYLTQLQQEEEAKKKISGGKNKSIFSSIKDFGKNIFDDVSNKLSDALNLEHFGGLGSTPFYAAESGLQNKQAQASTEENMSFGELPQMGKQNENMSFGELPAIDKQNKEEDKTPQEVGAPQEEGPGGAPLIDEKGNVVVPKAQEQMNMGIPPNPYLSSAIDSSLGLMGVSDSKIDSVVNDPFKDKSSIDTDIISYSDSNLTTILRNFQSGNDLFQAYQTNSQFRDGVNELLSHSKKYGSIEDMANDVIPMVGLNTQPQTRDEYLASIGGLLSGGDRYTQAANQQLMLTSQYLSDLQKNMYQDNLLELNMAYEIRDEYARKLAREEIVEEEKADLMRDKLRNDHKIQMAELEDSRLSTKNYLTETLASLGALRTDGQASVAVAKLDEKYARTKSQLNSQYNFALRELEMNMNDKMFELRNQYDMNMLKITYDLNKTALETDREMNKIKYNFAMDSIKIREDRDDKLERASERAVSNLIKAQEDYYLQFFDVHGLGQFLAEDKDYQETWKRNVREWITDDYKGQITHEDVRKSADEYYAQRAQASIDLTPAKKGELLRKFMSTANMEDPTTQEIINGINRGDMYYISFVEGVLDSQK